MKRDLMACANSEDFDWPVLSKAFFPHIQFMNHGGSSKRKSKTLIR